MPRRDRRGARPLRAREIDEQAAARELRGEAGQARRDKAERDPNDPDAASTPSFWSHLAAAAAPWRKPITPEEYQQLGRALD